MKLRKLLTRAMPTAVLLTATFAIVPYAQESSSGTKNVPASESFQQAEEHTEQAAPNAYEDAKTVVNDTSITLKVKTALHRDEVTGASAGNIHISTTAGIVTLKGEVPTVETFAHAELLARSTQGVRDVVNELQIASATD
jgi:osmotically-inducible protein OsmY